MNKKNILFIGNDLYGNERDLKCDLLISRLCENREKIHKMSLEDMEKIIEEKKAVTCIIEGKIQHEWCVFNELKNLDEPRTYGIYVTDYFNSEIEKLNINGCVCRTFEDALNVIQSQKIHEFDLCVIDINFLGDTKIAEKQFKSSYFFKYSETKSYAPFGVLVAEKLKKINIPFIFFTTDIPHAANALNLLVDKEIISRNDLNFVSTKFSSIGQSSWNRKPQLIISKNNLLAVGPKIHLETWHMLIEFIKKL